MPNIVNKALRILKSITKWSVFAFSLLTILLLFSGNQVLIGIILSFSTLLFLPFTREIINKVSLNSLKIAVPRYFFSIVSGLFLIISLGVAVSSLPASTPRETKKTGEVAGISETKEDNKELEEAKQKADEERIAREKLQNQIDNASKINPDVTFEDDENAEENLDSKKAKQENISIANFGESTEGKKLFDVTRVVDGDTIKVSELGTLRIIGINTPETKDPRKALQCFGQEASDKASELLKGKKVYLEFDPANRTDRYGRTLAYVYLENGQSFNKTMIESGFAFAYTKYPHPKLEEYKNAQSQASNTKQGLWSENTCNGEQKPAVKTRTQINIPRPNFTPIPARPKPISTPKPAPIPQPSNLAPAPPTPSASGFIAGTCPELIARSLGNFRPGDPNYTSRRDGDKDGIACEM